MIQIVRLIITALLLLTSNILQAQTNNIQVKFIGNCGLHITDGITNIYTDFPYKSGAHNYMEFDTSQLDSIKTNSIFIFTHKHSDHYSRKALKQVLKHKKGQVFGPWNIPDLEKLGDSLSEFKIEAFKTEHKVFGIAFKHYSYLISWHGKHIYLSGDTENSETINTLKQIDWAFIPYWLFIDSKEKDIKIDAKKLFIYHLAPSQIPAAKNKWNLVDYIHPLTVQGEKFLLKIAN